jgi:hypothetical protein
MADEQEDELLLHLRRAIAEGHIPAALALRQKAQQQRPNWNPPEPELMGLIKLMHSQQKWPESVPLMVEYVQHHGKSEKATRVRLKLAQVLLRDQQRPVQALRVLSEIHVSALSESLKPIHQQLVQKAEQMRDVGMYEVEGDF